MTHRCGTPAGYYRHLRRDETPCDSCRSAHADAARDYRGRRRPQRARHITVPAELFAGMYLSTTVEQQEAAEAAVGLDVITRAVREYDRRTS